MSFEAAPVAAGGALRGETMKLVTKAALASLALAAPAQAADLFDSAAPASFPESQAPTTVEIGSNWYLRGDIGVSFDDAPSVSFSSIAGPHADGSGKPIPAVTGPNALTTDFDGTVGFGYRFSDFLRFDATWDYRTGPGANSSSTVWCPYALYPVVRTPSGTIESIPGLPAALTQHQISPTEAVNLANAFGLGYFASPKDTCNGVMTLRQHTNTFLANAYVDIGTWNGFTPYVGGGLGLNVLYGSGGLNYFETANGNPYAADLTGYQLAWVNANGYPLTPQPAIAFNQQNWNRTIDSTTYGLAWALMAGVSYQFTPSIAIDIGYRYLNGGSTKTLLNVQTGTTLKQSNVSQQVRVGVRYLIQ